METLQTQFARSRRLRRAVMRRVWYVFALSIVLRPAIVLGAMFGASAIAFWKLVSITSIIENFLQVKVGNMPTYVGEALWQADIAALVAFIGLSTGALIVIGKMVAVLTTAYRTRMQMM